MIETLVNILAGIGALAVVGVCVAMIYANEWRKRAGWHFWERP